MKTEPSPFILAAIDFQEAMNETIQHTDADSLPRYTAVKELMYLGRAMEQGRQTLGAHKSDPDIEAVTTAVENAMRDICSAPRHGTPESEVLWNRLVISINRAIEFVRAIPLAANRGVAKADSAEGKGKADGAGKLEWLAKAMMHVTSNPEWSDAKIAGKVGRDKSRLTRSREYKAAAALARRQQPKPTGSVSVDPNTQTRTLEAVDDGIGDDEQEEIDARIDRETPKRNATRNAKTHKHQ